MLKPLCGSQELKHGNIRPHYLPMRNLYASQEETIISRHKKKDWFKIAKGCIISHGLFDLYAGASSLCFPCHAQQWRQQAALGSQGVDCSRSSSFGCPWLQEPLQFQRQEQEVQEQMQTWTIPRRARL